MRIIYFYQLFIKKKTIKDSKMQYQKYENNLNQTSLNIKSKKKLTIIIE